MCVCFDGYFLIDMCIQKLLILRTLIHLDFPFIQHLYILFTFLN